MAVLTKAVLETPVDSFGSTIVTTYLSGGGTTATAVIAAAASTQQVILGGVLSHNGGAAESVAVISGSTTIATLYLPAVAGTIDLACLRGLNTDAGEALSVKKSGETALVAITLHTRPLKAGGRIPNLY